MIQVGTTFRVVDNSGARFACCIKVFPGFRRRYAEIGDVVKVSVKALRTKRRTLLKIKKGEVINALIVKTKNGLPTHSGDTINFLEKPSVVLLSNKGKYVGTRVRGSLPRSFRYTKYLKVLSLASGISYF